MTERSGSVIVRAKDSERTIGQTLALLRRQTVAVEILVIDSGSTDRTRAIAGRWCDELIDMPAGEFTPGRALNVGAGAASSPIHFAVSSHCFPQREDWVERSLAHYERPDVAATGGQMYFADGRRVTDVFIQDAAHARSEPHWGFSNHASSWRASVWERFPFDEALVTAEDRKWALEVLDAGWRIAFDPALWVDMSHRFLPGVAHLYRRQLREARVVAGFSFRPPYSFGDCLRKWWYEGPENRPRARNRLNYLRIAELAAKYVGQRQARARGGVMPRGQRDP